MTTTTLFDQSYYAFPLSKEHLEAGNKIIMPASALEQLTSMTMKLVYPMLFRITSYATRRHSHCGVVEFTADEGSVLLPTWMMKSMKIQEGDLVNIRNASLRKGTYIKIQPHATKFINLSNPKSLLEKAFRDFACLTTGDTIEINHANHKYLIDVLETKPSRAVSMFDTDCEVDFAQPLDYKEPEKKTSVLGKREHATLGDEDQPEKKTSAPGKPERATLGDEDQPEKKTSVLGKRERTTLGDEDRKSRPTYDEEPKLFPGEGRRLGGPTTLPPGVNSFDQSMKKLKIKEVDTTKNVDGKPKCKQGTAEFKPFSGKAKRMDGQPIIAVVAKDVEHDQSNARVKVKKEEHQGFKAFTGKSFRLM